MLVCGSSLRRDLSSRTDDSGVAPPDYRSVHAVHGPVYFRALDDAGFSAANSLAEDVFVLTASFGIHLLRPVAPGDMKAIGKVVQASKNMFIAEATLTNSKGEEIARGIGTHVRSKAPLSPDIGYE